MRTADRLITYLNHNGWESAQVENDDYQLEIHPVHGMQEAAFTLWQRRLGDRLDLITSGHTYDGELVTAENHALDLPDDVLRTMDDMLEG